MKIRSGFVSNSSSSSFIAVGFYTYHNEELTNKVFDAIKFDSDCDDIDTALGKCGFKVGNQGQYVNKDRISFFLTDSEVACIGMEIKDSLSAGKTVPDLREDFMRKLEKLGIELAEDDNIELICDTFGWG